MNHGTISHKRLASITSSLSAGAYTGSDEALRLKIGLAHESMSLAVTRWGGQEATFIHDGKACRLGEQRQFSCDHELGID